jgi:murein DD-endopeptidase MepM/ murein hydrolase activator NlpD
MISLEQAKKQLNQFISIFTDKRRKGNLISRPFKLIFNKEQIKKIPGYFLIFTLGMSTFLVYPPSVLGKNNVSLTPKNMHPITTEHTFQRPVEGYISQEYHWGHPAVDIAGNYNKNIFPVSKGTVIEVKHSYWGYGKRVVVDHGNNLTSLYAHFNTIKVETGQEVVKNTPLGTVGGTGWSTGPHLHLEIWHNDKPLNPLEVVPDL